MNEVNYRVQEMFCIQLTQWGRIRYGREFRCLADIDPDEIKRILDETVEKLQALNPTDSGVFIGLE